MSIKRLLILNVAAVAILLAFFVLMTGNAYAAQKDVSVIFTGDVHSHLESVDGVGGSAKIKTAVDSIKKTYPDSTLFDSGDFSMGTPYQTIFMSHAAEMQVMGAIGYDAVTFGNHEFDYGPTGLAKMLNSASRYKTPKIVISNINWDKTLSSKSLAANAKTLKKACDDYGVCNWTIIKKGDVRVAVFGLEGHESIADAPSSGLKWTDYITSAKKTVKEIKASGRADVIVCLSHCGVYASQGDDAEDIQLAKQVPGIDLILSGHSHETITSALKEGHTYIVSSGYYGQKVGHVVLTKSGSRYKLKSYDLINLDKTVKEDKTVKAMVQSFKSVISKEYFGKFGLTYNQVLTTNKYTYTDQTILGDSHEEDPFGDLLSDSYIYALKHADKKYHNIDVAIVPSGVVRSTFAKGNVTAADTFNTLSLGIGPDNIPGYPLVNLYLTGKDLKLLAEVDTTVSDYMSGVTFYCSGYSYGYSTHRIPMNRAVDFKIVKSNGKTEKVQNDKLYSCVTDLYTCRMLGAVQNASKGLLKVVPKDKNGNAVTAYESGIVYSSGREVKAWYALAEYTQSFNGTIPAYYNTTHDRKINETNWNLWTMVKQPNIFSLIVYAVLAVIVLVIVLIVKHRRKRHRK